FFRKKCMRWACSAQSLGSEDTRLSGMNSIPFFSLTNTIFPDCQEEVAMAEDSFLGSRSFSSYSLGLNSDNFPNRDNTIRLWDIEVGKCRHDNNLNDTRAVLSGTNRFQKSPQVFMFLLPDTVSIREEKTLLYVWDPRNFRRSLSFSLVNEFNTLHITVKFNDKKIYVCDDLKERVFDLRMGGAPLDKVKMNHFREEESALLNGKVVGRLFIRWRDPANCGVWKKLCIFLVSNN
ncbi:hypothetical protein KI387_024251, partial [Taxus chinensis]